MTGSRWVVTVVLVGALACALPGARAQGDAFAEARRELADHVASVGRQFPALGGFGFDARLIDAFAHVPRHRFLPGELAPLAYHDRPLPLGFGQNLTQPSLLALMTQVLHIKPGMRVFETGTDTGYQAAILAEMGAQVYSMEVVAPLLKVARAVLEFLGYKGITMEQGDGRGGWPDKAPFDAILVKESAPEVPAALWAQLKPGGRMVIPLGPAQGPQFLMLLIKHADGRVERQPLLPVLFAPFQGGEPT